MEYVVVMQYKKIIRHDKLVFSFANAQYKFSKKV